MNHIVFVRKFAPCVQNIKQNVNFSSAQRLANHNRDHSYAQVLQSFKKKNILSALIEKKANNKSF